MKTNKNNTNGTIITISASTSTSYKLFRALSNISNELDKPVSVEEIENVIAETARDHSRNIEGGKVSWIADNENGRRTFTLELQEEATAMAIETGLKFAEVIKPIFTLGKAFVDVAKSVKNQLKGISEDHSKRFAAKFGGTRKYSLINLYDTEMKYVAVVVFEDDGLGNPVHVKGCSITSFGEIRIEHGYAEPIAWQKLKSNDQDWKAYTNEELKTEVDRRMKSLRADMDGELNKKVDEAAEKVKADLNLVESWDAKIKEMQKPASERRNKRFNPLGKICGTTRLVDLGEGEFVVIDRNTPEYSFGAVVDLRTKRTVEEFMSGNIDKARSVMGSIIGQISSSNLKIYNSHRAAYEAFEDLHEIHAQERKSW